MRPRVEPIHREMRRAVPDRSEGHRLSRYFRATERPLPSLLAVLPLVALYEAGTRGWFGSQPAGPAEQLVAFSLLRRGFESAGATGAMLPAMTLVACLLGWHVVQRDPWAVKIRDVMAVWVEGALLAFPVIALAIAMRRWLPLVATTDSIEPARLATLAVGAAVYEELLFRLIAFAALHALWVDVLGLRQRAGGVLTVFCSAALFAAYHYLGQETFQWPSFVFRTTAGVFLGALFVSRGFGVTAVCHAAYDIACVAIFWRVLSE